MQRCRPPAWVTRESFEREASFLKAIADPYRLRILATLDRAIDEVYVCDFTDALPLNQPTVSHHLPILCEAGLVTRERRGTWAYHRIAPDAKRRVAAAIDAVLSPKVTT